MAQHSAGRQRFFKWLPTLRQLQIGALVALFAFLGGLALTFDEWGQRRRLQEVGEVATQDIVAPQSLRFVSQILTEQARQAAINQVPPAYDPNPDVTREQIRLVRLATAYISEIRADPYSDEPTHIADLNALSPLQVEESIWRATLRLSEARWDLISSEVAALVDRSMQGNVRPENVDEVRRALVNQVASRFSDEEATIIVALAQDFIIPNTFYNESLTRQRQQEAAQQVLPQERRFEQNQLVVRAGSVISELDVEALQAFGLLAGHGRRFEALMGALIAMVLTMGIFSLYLQRFEPQFWADPRALGLLSLLFLIFLWGLRVFDVQEGTQLYLYPAAAFGMILANIVRPRLGLLTVSLLALVLGLAVPTENALALFAYTLFGNFVAILSLRRVERLNNYFVTGVIVGLVNILVVTMFSFMADSVPSAQRWVTQIVFAFFNGLLSAGVALIGLYIITSTLNLPTGLKMLELMDSQNPLLQRLLREAPGTYQHSLQVGNLAEIAAEAIGANAQLIRVAAMYHDIGKVLNPHFFVENLNEGLSPHEHLNDALQSARIIIGHVTEGERMARRANLPQRLIDFILEHHGTTQVLYFYQLALQRGDLEPSQLNITDFTYPGPLPRSRETAILMLADGCESATRSRRLTQKSEIEEVVNHIFELRLSEGQLDESGLTLNDLKRIRQAFLQTLQAMYHSRIAYGTPTKSAGQERAKLATGIIKTLEAPAVTLEAGQAEKPPEDPKASS